MQTLSVGLAALASLFQSAKHSASKALLTNYAKSTSILNMIFMKHMVKTILYILIILFLSNEKIGKSLNNLINLVKDRKNSKSSNILLGLVLVASFEIAFAFPYYTGLRMFDLSSYVLMITIFTILFNIFSGYINFNETFNMQKIFGIALCIVGIIFIKLSNGDKI